MSPLLELAGVLGIVTIIATPICLLVVWVSNRAIPEYDRQSSRSPRQRRGPR